MFPMYIIMLQVYWLTLYISWCNYEDNLWFKWSKK